MRMRAVVIRVQFGWQQSLDAKQGDALGGNDRPDDGPRPGREHGIGDRWGQVGPADDAEDAPRRARRLVQRMDAGEVGEVLPPSSIWVTNSRALSREATTSSLRRARA